MPGEVHAGDLRYFFRPTIIPQRPVAQLIPEQEQVVPRFLMAEVTGGGVQIDYRA